MIKQRRDQPVSCCRQGPGSWAELGWGIQRAGSREGKPILKECGFEPVGRNRDLGSRQGRASRGVRAGVSMRAVEERQGHYGIEGP